MRLKYGISGLIACLCASAACAAPWLEPGDLRARFAVQKLADRGHLETPVTAWPLMWRNLQGSASTDQAATGTAAAYLQFERRQQFREGSRGEFTLSGQTDVPAITGFGGYSPGEASAGVDLQWQGQSR